MQTKTLTALFLAGAVALGAGSAFAGAPAAKPAEAAKPADASKDVYDNWRLTCGTPNGAKAELCEIFQPMTNVLGKDPNDPTKVRVQLLATLSVFKVPGAEKAQIIIKAPLGALLQAPVLKVPGHKDLAFPYLVCDQSGCTTISMGLDKEFIDAVRAAEALETAPDKAQGVLVLALPVTRPEQATKPEAVNVKFGFKGFGKAFDALNKRVPSPSEKKDAPKKDTPKKK